MWQIYIYFLDKSSSNFRLYLFLGLINEHVFRVDSAIHEALQCEVISPEQNFLLPNHNKRLRQGFPVLHQYR